MPQHPTNSGPPPLVSPDGTIRIGIEPIEWANSHWVNAPCLTDLIRNRVVFDLRGTDCDAVVRFPAADVANLSFRRYRTRQTFDLTVNAGQNRFDFVPGHDVAMSSQSGPLADLAPLLASLVSWEPMKEPTSANRPAPVAWKALFGIAILAAVMIAGVGYIAYLHDPEPHVRLTPMPAPVTANRP